MNNKLRNKTIGTQLARLTLSTLLMCAVALAVTALRAGSPVEKQTRPGKCQKWADDNRAKVKPVFQKALDDSALDTEAGKARRAKLLSSPLEAIQDIYKEMYPKEKPLEFAPELLIKFWEQELPNDCLTAKATTASCYREDHCIHIFRLPEVGEHPTVETNLSCCYKPW